MKKYDKYKPSGVEWLGNIPEHWKIDRIKNIGSVNGRVGWKALKATEYVDSGYFFLSTPNIKNVEIDYFNVNYITHERYVESPEIMLNNDDILLVKDGSTLGIVNIIKKLPAMGTVNSSIAVLRFKKQQSNYIFYLLKSNFTQNTIRLKKEGMGVPHLFQRDINNFSILLPELTEQTAIATYLDRKTAAIDKKVSLLEKETEYYKELRKSLINQTVTKGLNKNVKLKHSGIDWIGEIPEHWEVNQIKRSLKLLTDYDANGSFSDIKNNVNRVEADKDKFAWFVRTTDLEKFSNDLENNNYIWIDEKTYNYLRKSKLFGGELLLAKRGDIGKIYLMPQIDKPASLAPNLYLARLNEKVITSKYAYYYLILLYDFKILPIVFPFDNIGQYLFAVYDV